MTAQATLEFRHKPHTRNSHAAHALINGEVVAELTWWTTKPDQRTAKGAVRHVWTDPDYRRQGIATALWQYAHSLDVTKPRHSRNRTRDGKAWIQSLKK